MKFFYEHSEFLPYALIIIGGIIVWLLLFGWCKWCREMKRQDNIYENEFQKEYYKKHKKFPTQIDHL